MRFAGSLFALGAYLKISLVVYPAREQLYIFYGVDRRPRNHFLLTVLLSLLVFGVPCVYPDVTNLLGLLGGVTVGTCGYMVPLLLKVVSLRSKPFGPAHAVYAFLLLLVVCIQVSSASMSIRDSFFKKK